MPRYNIKRGVFLSALEKFASQLVHYLPRLLLDFVLGSRMQKVSGVGQPVGTKGSKFGQLKVRAPDLCYL